MNFLGGLFVVPKESVDTNVHDPSRSLVGTGPWYLDEYEPSVRAVFKANPGYQHEGLPYMDAMELPIVGEYAAALSQFRAGNIYHLDISQEDLLPAKRDLPDLDIIATPNLASQLWHVIFGKLGPFVDERLRQAYVLTWDREAILDTFYNVSAFEAEGFPVHTVYESGIQGNHWEGWFLDASNESEFGPNAKYLQFNLEEARRLVEAAGSPDGVSMKIHHPSPGINPQWEFLNQVIAGMANDSGLFNGEFEPHQRVPDFIPNFQASKGEFDGIAHYYANQPQDPTIYLYSFYHPAGGQVGITDAKMEELIDASVHEFDREKRKELTWEIQRYEAEKQFFPRLVAGTIFDVFWPVMRNVNVFASTSENYSRWFIDPSKPPLA
jgi:ABC-type transport system substrate-binding protein